MKIIDLLHETYSALSSNRVRSGLTMLGIIIGISSVIAMVSIGQGAQNTIESSINSIGSNLLVVTPGAQKGPGVMISAGRGSAKSITLSDAEIIKKEVILAKGVAPEVSKRYQVTAKGTNTNVSISGTVPDYMIVRNIEIDFGSFITEQNVKSGSKVAVLGPTTRDDLFGEDADPIGQTIRINKIDFKVIGVTVSKGGSGMSNADDIIYVPISVAQRYFSGDEYLSNINIAAESADVMTEIQNQVTDLLIVSHKIKDPTILDFSIMNQADMVATASSVTTTLTLLLSAIAGISLVVGGIGIMNMMLTTVTERTREIGLRKAIGAKRKDITLQFLAEAIMLTFVGGGIGIFLGWLVAFLLSYFGIIQASVTITSILLAFGVSTAIGIVFGYYPAYRAARLNPIEALRYE
ncbi:MAG: ABC transporter, permease protein [Parcubacteria group bacterium GW2011_GWF2_38_76]|nr:MAG: ABC transporter, permease protein [Parcubacteria group bacterium GW2011_GWF2_38_76]HBM46222.1 multidrug ABC transporter substrate-binding protein [Patescibacteria group bacterium]